MVNKGITVAELLNECKIMVKNGYGDRHIQISRDDEGNGFHSLFYGFTYNESALNDYLEMGMYESFNIKTEKDLEDIVILG